MASDLTNIKNGHLIIRYTTGLCMIHECMGCEYSDLEATLAEFNADPDTAVHQQGIPYEVPLAYIWDSDTNTMWAQQEDGTWVAGTNSAVHATQNS